MVNDLVKVFVVLFRFGYGIGWRHDCDALANVAYRVQSTIV